MDVVGCIIEFSVEIMVLEDLVIDFLVVGNISCGFVNGMLVVFVGDVGLVFF